MSTQLKAVVQGDIPANRLVCLTRPADADDNTIYIRLAMERERPDFFSLEDLSDGKEVDVNIKNNPTWKAEAAEDIPAGYSIEAGPDGKVVKMATNPAGAPGHEATIGYTLHAVKAGEVAKFVKNYKIAALWFDRVNAAIDGGGA